GFVVGVDAKIVLRDAVRQVDNLIAHQESMIGGPIAIRLRQVGAGLAVRGILRRSLAFPHAKKCTENVDIRIDGRGTHREKNRKLGSFHFEVSSNDTPGSGSSCIFWLLLTHLSRTNA